MQQCVPPRTCAAERVAHGDRAAVGVDLLGVQAQLLDAVRRLRTPDSLGLQPLPHPYLAPAPLGSGVSSKAAAYLPSTHRQTC